MSARAALVAAVVSLACAAAAQASSHASNFQTTSGEVACGVARSVPGSELDPGTGASLDGDYPGVQCSAPGIPKPARGIGDPFVQLGQGAAGRARLRDESQDELVSDAAPKTLARGSTWRRDGITCTLTASRVRCANSAGAGFAISPGHLVLF
jgi:hypothetical protein